MDPELLYSFKKALVNAKRGELRALEEGRESDANEAAETYDTILAMFEDLSKFKHRIDPEEQAYTISILKHTDQFNPSPKKTSFPLASPTGPLRRPGGAPAFSHAPPPPPAEYDFASPEAPAPPSPAAVPDFAPVVPSPKSRGRSPPPELGLTPPLSPFSQKPARFAPLSPLPALSPPPAAERSPLSPPPRAAAYLPRAIPAAPPAPPQLSAPSGIIRRLGRSPVRQHPFGKRK